MSRARARLHRNDDPELLHNTREDIENVVRCRWTRKWWDEHRGEYDLYTSAVVVRELSEGDHPLKGEKLDLLNEVPILDERAEVEETAAVYVREFLMPARTFADAFHMSFASVYRCDILATWNFTHLANLNKRRHLIAINSRLGLPVPWVVSPFELLGENVDE